MVAPELVADDAGVSCGSGPEIVGEFELAPLVSVGADQFLHDRQQDPRRVDWQRAPRGTQDLFPQRAKCAQAVIHAACLEGFEQVDDGEGDPQALRFRHLLDAVGVEVGQDQIPHPFARFVAGEDIVDDVQQVVVPFVEKESGHEVKGASGRGKG